MVTILWDNWSDRLERNLRILLKKKSVVLCPILIIKFIWKKNEIVIKILIYKEIKLNQNI